MECIEARALKSSFLSQMAMKTVFYNDDVSCLTGINNAASDDFPVEDLLNLDFSDKDQFQEGCFSQEDEISLKGSSIYSSASSTFSGADDFDCPSAAELTLPVDDLENLEWLSQFVDDSAAAGLSLLCPAGSFMAKTESISESRFIPVNRPPQKTRSPCFPFPVPVPGKARSKRSRSNGRPWSLVSPPLSSADSSTSSSSYGSSVLSPFPFKSAVHDLEWFSSVEKPPLKKQKRKTDSEAGSVTGRRCTHCQVQKTPQWRTGPLGPKTLCNACGVRFKSGRLFAEYRPACSPTFSKELHSNSHRKVLEMRQKKDVTEMPEPEWAPAVQSQ